MASLKLSSTKRRYLAIIYIAAAGFLVTQYCLTSSPLLSDFGRYGFLRRSYMGQHTRFGIREGDPFTRVDEFDSLSYDEDMAQKLQAAAEEYAEIPIEFPDESEIVEIEAAQAAQLEAAQLKSDSIELHTQSWLAFTDPKDSRVWKEWLYGVYKKPQGRKSNKDRVHDNPLALANHPLSSPEEVLPLNLVPVSDDDKETLAANATGAVILHGPDGQEHRIDGTSPKVEAALTGLVATARAAVNKTSLMLYPMPTSWGKSGESTEFFVTQQNYKRELEGAGLDFANALNFLPETQPEFNVRTCAAVAPSGSLVVKPRGDQIDKHAGVIRFNAAPAVKYESGVGKKTHFRLLSRKAIGAYLGGASETFAPELDANVTIILARVRVKELVDFSQWLQRTHPGVQLLVVAAQVVSEVQAVLRRFREGAITLGISYRGGHHVSTGLMGVMLALHMCQRVTLVGFGQAIDKGSGLQLLPAWRNTEHPQCNPNAAYYASTKGGKRRGGLPSYSYYSKTKYDGASKLSLTAEADFLKALERMMQNRVVWCAPGVLMLQ
uniref:Uncharacterized protein n=1 Tax=Pyramimonas obovata TaxID=1411642 RepID=A0A7S0WZ31_9CHLO|mmetsp:Transcript_9604/g.19903  ORF Transcript_9604/g.19903 Transcript_9604/m.19903 type:complete len:550 (+) Transcript_9604:135-1784(+)